MKRAFLALAKFPKQEQVTDFGVGTERRYLEEAAAGALRRTRPMPPAGASVRVAGTSGE